MKNHLFILLLTLSTIVQAQTWTVEAEDASSSVRWKGNEADIIAPKGLTLWCDELMTGNTVIEYEAQITKDKHFLDPQGKPRISDLNCFWMADHPLGRQGANFVEHYALQTYYMGYGGNWNTTTRFRRYNGDSRGIDSTQYRPIILKEYTDAQHLLQPDHWYKIRLEQIDGHVRYFIDGECLVDYFDLKPLTQGYFGFRTTQAHAKLRNFHYTCNNPDEQPIVLRWIGNKGSGPVTFGVPFDKGEVTTSDFTLRTDKGVILPLDTWRLASWQDGSAKWQAFTAIVPEGTDSVLLTKKPYTLLKMVPALPKKSFPPFYVTLNGERCPILSHEVESKGNFREVHKYTGKNFIIRTYQYTGKDAGTKEMKLVHTLLVDSALNKKGLHELSIHFKVPVHGPAYERFVSFADPLHPSGTSPSMGRKGSYSLSVQPLIARRPINLEQKDSITQTMLDNIAQWDDFRLSQLSPNGFSIRKRATHESPWIGTIEGHRSEGMVIVGDSTSHTSFRLEDFWQSYPSTLLVSGMRGDTATVTISLYSPEAEAYSFEHYDTIAHTLEASYEDVQPGMSTAWGIGRTSNILINAQEEYHLACTPEYLHRKRAFGIWSLPTIENSQDSLIESLLTDIMDFYELEIERHGWYGFFNYGDVMHAYDASRDEWRYDVGGFAWDNTELGTPSMFWYQFLRTGNPKVFRMAEAMTRHCSEVDTYHLGPHAGLGTRHNVIHWGCGAKEARISEAWWNRFYYYLTADERTGDIMHEVRDADTLLYTLDPMRLAEPRSLYPCTAPARLRIGPDWLAYVSNWFTEWERTDPQTLSPVMGREDHPAGSPHRGGDVRRTEGVYLSKILAGMNSIAKFPHGFFEGPKALGYDPATGIITNECDSSIQNTNHLLAIMGGFELLNELQFSIDHPGFFAQWLNHCKDYKQKAWEMSRNKFRIPRITAYAAWQLGDEKLRQTAWKDFLDRRPTLQGADMIWTNEAAAWTLDAIFIKEVIR